MRNTRIWIVLGALGLLVVAGVVAGIMVWPDEETLQAAADPSKPKSNSELKPVADLPPTDLQTPEQTVEMLASEEFHGLSSDKKEAYYQELLDTNEAQGEDRGAIMGAFFRAAGKMDDQQKERLQENARELGMAFMERRLDEYFALSQEAKNAHLDERIDQIQQWRERSDGQDGGGHRRGGGRRRGLTPEMLERFIEHVPPARRAKFVQYRLDIRDRMEERGINSDW